MSSCCQERVPTSHGHRWGQVIPSIVFVQGRFSGKIQCIFCCALELFSAQFNGVFFPHHSHQSTGAVLAGRHRLRQRISLCSRCCLDASLLVTSGHCKQDQHQDNKSSLQSNPLGVLEERENLYSMLSQTTDENLNKNFKGYSLDPRSRCLTFLLPIPTFSFCFYKGTKIFLGRRKMRRSWPSTTQITRRRWGDFERR